MPFARGKPSPAGAGRRKGTPNRGTERARRLISEADLEAIVKQVVEGAKLGDPDARRTYFRYLRPPTPRFAGTIDLEPPKTAQEARGAIAKITSLIARAESTASTGPALLAASGPS
jgi:hypothetical protein